MHTIHKHTENEPAKTCSSTGHAWIPPAGGQCGGPYLRAVQGTTLGRTRSFKNLKPGANEGWANASAYCIWEILYIQGTDGGQRSNKHHRDPETLLWPFSGVFLMLATNMQNVFFCFYSLQFWGWSVMWCSAENHLMTHRSWGILSTSSTFAWWIRHMWLSTR